MSSLTLHFLERSRSQRIVWLLEELGVPYELKYYKRTPELRSPKELFAIHPLGKAPVITDGSLTIAESGPIVEYLIEKYGNGRFTPTPEGILDNRYFTHYAEGTYQPPLVMRRLVDYIASLATEDRRAIVAQELAKFDKGFLGPDIELHSKLVESQLEKSGDWLAGGPEPTSADFLMAFTLQVSWSRAPDFIGPKTKEYLVRVQERPAHKRAIERVGSLEDVYLYTAN